MKIYCVLLSQFGKGKSYLSIKVSQILFISSMTNILFKIILILLITIVSIQKMGFVKYRK